ncbi:competence protein, ComEC family [Campylobacter blaseri]|uniref:Competence protein ComEC n=1 Tax=Campylobacter blaseri TaxID=2042961 RepID=A0A2P8QZV7_9BACT|nr:ComEC/Rec2 family competence protein [Campylobacter blaseri]PSM51776.1 competence protein ComEC [Campylobacter blaseri]PSM53567.1 competence protein ComEC [Campylobacter blaseri]QKF86377.1 competence protein, ComEC family [Campylobacter blaseri]
MNGLKLFNKFSEILIFIAICLAIFSINIFIKHNEFRHFKEDKFQKIDAKVLSSYTKTNKKGRVYRVLKLKTNDFIFYTITKKETNFKELDMLNLGIVTDRVDFKDYLKKSFYMPSFNIEKVKINKTLKDKAIKYVASQHQSLQIQNLYLALFFATPINKELRQNIVKWGISHLVAISGFHLSIIFTTIFFILTPIYKFFQNRFFPYRSLVFDISLLTFFLMVGYLFVLDFTPSFLRSLLMALVLFVFLVRNLKVFSFQTLFITMLIAISFFPHLLFSYGFYFSCLGVFYIYLYIHHFAKSFNVYINIIFLNLFVYLAMNIPVYYFFPNFTYTQISVVFISYIFIIFYPLSLLLHLVNFGSIFDEYLIMFLNYPVEMHQINISKFLFYGVNLLSLLAIRYKILALLLALIGLYPIVLFLL